MILGSEIALWDKSLAAKNDRSSLYFPDDTIRPDINNQSLQRVPFGTIIEYDKDGKVFWSWKTSKYFKSIIKSDKNIKLRFKCPNSYRYMSPDKEATFIDNCHFRVGGIPLMNKFQCSIEQINVEDGRKRGLRRLVVSAIRRQHYARSGAMAAFSRPRISR